MGEIIQGIKERILRFIYSDTEITSQQSEIDFLRLELERERLEKKKLLDYVLEMNKARTVLADSINERDSAVTDFRPVSNTRYQTWSQKRATLERESVERANKLKQEARVAVEKDKLTVTVSKSVEQLETELGITGITTNAE